MVRKKEDDVEKVLKVLRDNRRGLNINEIARKTKIPKYAVRIVLSKLEGEKRLDIWMCGKSMIHTLIED